ncbi:twin-arginine translocase subunit TatC [Yinghuangia aomiensis]
MPSMDHLRELRAGWSNRCWRFWPSPWSRCSSTTRSRSSWSAPSATSTSRVSERARCPALVQKGVLSPFSTMLKVSFAVGVIAAAPIWLYQLWAFLAPGLHKHEKKYSLAFVGVGVPLFVAGAWFSYAILPHALDALLGFTIGEANNQIDLDEYLDFLVRMVAVFRSGVRAACWC